jgi:broad specificity phosphatase PhoE
MARHGQGEHQVQEGWIGNDPPLTSLGERQAHKLGAYLADNASVGAIYASDLERARRTAEIAASYLGMDVIFDLELREFDDWQHGWVPGPTSQWDSAPDTLELSQGYSRFRRRVKAALQRIITASEAHNTVLLVAHGGTLGTIWRILLGSDTPRIHCWNAALSEVSWVASDWGDAGNAWHFHYLNRMEYLPADLRTA